VTEFVFRERRGYRRAQRALDLFGAGLALVLALPLLGLACAAIALEDGPPFVFRQQRVGRFGRLFTIYKLRTMRKAVCVDARKPGARDARITRIGALLRRSSIDELPQLINVLRGDMALVGPRPEMPFVVARYERWQHLRHLAKPGITGLWQTRGRSTIPLERPEATELDLEYVRRASTAFDGLLIARTVTTVLRARGAY
jgi:lipopolysaccharide/colanic/teichoic acid biosynthesis glycosyltransferase